MLLLCDQKPSAVPLFLQSRVLLEGLKSPPVINCPSQVILIELNNQSWLGHLPQSPISILVGDLSMLARVNQRIEWLFVEAILVNQRECLALFQAHYSHRF